MGWPLSSGERRENIAPVNCTYAGGANNKGSWVQAIAATAFDYQALRVNLMQVISDGGGDAFLVDIGIGASGSEIVVIPNLLIDYLRLSHPGLIFSCLIPVAIPSGTRIAVRCQTSLGAGARNARVRLSGVNGGFNAPPASGCALSNYGALTASTNGTLIDPGGTANTFGSWTEMTSATAADHRFMIPIIGNNKQTNATSQSDEYTMQIGVGASGSEEVIEEFFFGGIYATGILGNVLAQINANIPAGTRLAMRAKCTNGNADRRHCTATLLCG